MQHTRGSGTFTVLVLDEDGPISKNTESHSGFLHTSNPMYCAALSISELKIVPCLSETPSGPSRPE